MPSDPLRDAIQAIRDAPNDWHEDSTVTVVVQPHAPQPTIPDSDPPEAAGLSLRGPLGIRLGVRGVSGGQLLVVAVLVAVVAVAWLVTGRRAPAAAPPATHAPP